MARSSKSAPLKFGVTTEIFTTWSGSETVDGSHARSTALHLIKDPSVSLLKTGLQRSRGLPAKLTSYEGVIAATAADAFGSVEFIIALELDAGQFLREVDESINGDHLGTADVDRLRDVAFHEQAGAVKAVVDKHEAACLFAISPDLDFMTTGEFRGDDFATDRRGRLLPPAIKSAVRTIDIMIAGHAGLQAELFPKMPAHPFAEEFLPAIAVLRVCRIGVLLL